MDLRQIRENLARVKIYVNKGESLRALNVAVMALTPLVKAGTNLSTELRSLVREAAQTLAGDQNTKPHLKGSFAYQPGQERQLLVAMIMTMKDMEATANQEDHATALARKQRMDKALNLGRRALEQNKVSEADQCFQEAIKNYRDEHRVFQMIGKCLVDAGQPRRAIPYLKKATELEPDNTVAAELYGSALRAREENVR